MDKSKLRTLEEPLTKIVSSIRNYDAILWVGSGFSLYAGYPSGAELSKKILESAENSSDRAILEVHVNSLMDLSNEFSQLYSRDKLIDIIKKNFDVAPSTEPEAHYRITKIPQIDTIITTNYDHLFEMVYENKVTVCTGTIFKKTVKGMVDLYKIHGDTSYADSIIITSKDYAQFYNKLDTVLWNKIKGLLAEKSIIFVGYSLEDKNIQEVFEKIVSQIDSSDKEFFIVTPTLQEHKLKYLNNICKTTHIPLTGEELFEYIESEIRKNIVIDAIAKKVSVDEAYKICREHGITPTIVNEPYGSATKPVVEKVALSPENFFNQVFVPFGRGANFTSNPETYKDVETFINDCDCRELIIPAENAVIYQNINGIHIPENHKINGQFPNVVKLIKEEQVEKLNLTLGEDNSLGCDVCVRGFWGHIRSRMTIEMACINIGIVHDNETTSFNLGFRYPHLTADAISDLLRLELWSSGSDLVFNRSNKKQAFVLNGFSDKTKNSDLKSFIDNNAKLYREIQVIENDLNDKLCIDKELTTEDIKHIHMASSSISPNHVKYTGTYTANAGKLTLKQLDIYNDSKNVAMIQMTCSDVLPEDCFQLLGKNIVLGIRRIRLIEPYIKNMEEAKRMVEENRDVVLEFASKKDEAILEYILPDDLNY